MATSKPGDINPTVQWAPLGDLKVYPVYEHELDQVAQGSPASMLLNWALFLLPISITLIVTLTTTTIPPGYTFQTYVATFLVTLIASLVLFGLWFKMKRASKGLITTIKSRMSETPAQAPQTGQRVIFLPQPAALITSAAPAKLSTGSIVKSEEKPAKQPATRKK